MHAKSPRSIPHPKRYPTTFKIGLLSLIVATAMLLHGCATPLKPRGPACEKPPVPAYLLQPPQVTDFLTEAEKLQR